MRPLFSDPPFYDWEVLYRDVLRDWGTCFMDVRLRSAISGCMNVLSETPHAFSLDERRECLAALSDLLVLRSLQHRHRAQQMVEDSTR